MSDLTVTRVRVTGRHIEEGRPEDMYRCALALAVIDAIDNEGLQAYEVRVGAPGDGKRGGGWRAEVNLGDAMTVRQLTAALPDDVIRWDLELYEGFAVQPFEFDLTWEAAT